MDVDSLTATNIDIYIEMYNFTNCFIDGEFMLIVGYCRKIAILRDLKYIGKIDLDTIDESCKNGLTIHGTYSQQVGKTVYAVDRHGRLYRIEWQDIKEGKYQKTLVKPHVQNLYVDKELGVCTIENDTLSLESGTEVNLRKEAYYYSNWTVVTCVAKSWIVSGDRNHFGDCNLVRDVTMATISKRGKVISRFKIKQTSNGHKNRDCKKYGGIYSLRKVYVTGMRGIMMAIERDGCCHLISVDYGRLSVLQSIGSIVPSKVDNKSQRIVMSVTATGTRGEFIVGGWGWTRLITVKYK